MEQSPFFSIILPTFNRAGMISKAVESALSQSFSDWELIIIDDGSTDNTKEIIDKYNDNRIKYFYQTNQERSAARNNGIKKAEGRYICFLDSDDYYLDNHLKEFYEKLKTEEFPLTFLFSRMLFETDGIKKSYNIPEIIGINKFEFIIINTIGTPQVCISKTILDKYRFNEKIYVGEDKELWIRIVREYPIVRLNKTTVVAAIHNDRTVNLKKNNSAIKAYNVLKYIFSHEHSGNNISTGIQKTALSNCLYNCAKHHIYNRSKLRAINCLILSVVKKPIHAQTKHKVLLIVSLIPGIAWLFRKKELI